MLNFDSPLKVQQAVDVGQEMFVISGKVFIMKMLLLIIMMVFQAIPLFSSTYNDERVIFDGTKSINSEWTEYSANIWETTIEFDVWQLFVDYREMVMARWPNSNLKMVVYGTRRIGLMV